MTLILSSYKILIAFNFLLLAASKDPDINRTGPELIISKGFIFEEHFAKTPDGYILRLFRFHNPNVSAPLNSQKPPVLLQHGILDSSDCWVVNHRKTAFGFILADRGFDVWLGNNRGNKYSRNHTHFNPNAPLNHKFWNFTYDQLAMYDVPTQVKYVCQVTKVSKIPYIGHSQGTTQMFANLAQPQSPSFSIAQSLSIFVALAPVTYLSHTTSMLLKTVCELHLDQLISLLKDQEFLPSRKIFDILLPGLCGPLPGICDAVIQAIAGYNPDNMDDERLPVFVGHFPSGTSVKTLVHFAGGIRNNSFQMFDYGPQKNLIHYGQEIPPDYVLSKIKTPTALFYGGADTMGDVVDVERLISELPKSTVKSVDFHPKYAHLDFTWGKNSTAIYNKIIELIK